MNLGLIGIGNMGLGIARNLLKAGHQLTVYNRTGAKAEPLAADGARIAATAAGACRGEAVLTMLSDDAAVEQTARTVLEAQPNLTHISLSTISPALSQSLAQLHKARHQHYVAAPVFGRPEAAATAKLVVIAAGPVDIVERFRPVFEAIGQKLFHVGEEQNKANIIKVCGNFLLVSMLEGLGETFAVMRKSGIDPALFLEIVNGNLFRSPVYENYGKLIVEERYEPAGFRLRLGLKDVKLALAAAESVDVPMPLASLLRDHYVSGVARGYADLDWAALAKVIAEDAGLP